MRFGWTDEEKEKYFIKAEQQIEAAGFTDSLKIDKTSFGVQGQKMKVFLTPFHRAGNTKKWWEAKATRNAMILKVLNAMTAGKEVVISTIDSLKDVFNVSLDPAIATSSMVITNQSGYNYLDKLKDADGKYILQPNPTMATQMLLFGKYPIVKVSNKVIKSTEIKTGEAVTGYKHPVYIGDLKEAITLFDRNVMTIDMNDKAAGLWEKDMTGIKVRDRFDVQPVDEAAVIKGEITENVAG